MSANNTDSSSTANNAPSKESSEIQNKVCEIVTDVLGLDSKVDASQSLQDLGADSIDIATLVVTLQDEFPSEQVIEDRMMENIRTPAEITQLIVELAST